MKAVLISIQPKWCELIASGKKTVEVRKTKPKIEVPFKCYIYCTKGDALALPCLNNPHYTIHRINNGTLNGRQMTAKEREQSDHSFANGKVIGEFVCRGIMQPHISLSHMAKESCLTEQELFEYSNGKTLYGWRITDLVIYDKPKELSEFRTLDNEAVQKCEHRIQTYYAFTDTGYIKNGMACGFKDDWCDKCKTKPITRPPQSWCYVEELK